MKSDRSSSVYMLRRSSVLAMVLALLLAACGPVSGSREEEIEGVPGAFTFSEGKTAYRHLYRRAIEHLEQNEYRAAEAVYRELIEQEPGNANGYVGLGTALGLQERFREAETAYMQALRISPDSVAARIGLGSAYSGLDDLVRATEQYARALELDPDNLQAHWGLAVTFNRLGQTEESLEHLARIVELAPGTGLALDAQNLMREIRPGGD